MATEFKFVVDGVDLTQAQRTEIAQAVAAAGSLALNRTIAKDLGSFEVNGINLRKWELIGRYVLLGDRAQDLGAQVQELVNKQR
ncbi:MAG TPA: hypothetical protein VGR06_09120 [Actinophytocola sp.]|jgi:hypothetical protein|uniref:hypothetical protein n=1 Tax=Actinophytocola sp. TaxID=1872138 RepID=UPI002E02E0D9|nr:hypothetical protein [Actinophytocola sp.]